jgi:hypothetical protein
MLEAPFCPSLCTEGKECLDSVVLINYGECKIFIVQSFVFINVSATNKRKECL